MTETDQGYVYILTNMKFGTLYLGSTNNLVKRITDHKKGRSYFTNKYELRTLVWFKKCETLTDARKLEHQMKKWNREWKIREINQNNPKWNDLFGLL